MKTLIAIGLVMAFLSCDSADTTGACTEEARSSVTLKILDAASGDPLDEATIVYSVDGEDSPTITSCSNDESLVENCESFSIAYEVEGTFEITVSAPGYADKTRTTTIVKTADGCHVIGKVLTFNMTP